jgi:hypothetical protein
MKTLAVLFALLLASIGRLSAQITVGITMDQDQEQFLPGEAIHAAVCITNRSGQTLELGRDQEWLKFSVESREGHVVLKNGEVPVVEEFTLGSSQRAIRRVDLAPYFNLVKPGPYQVTATVTIKEWNQHITSAPKPFDVIEGSKLWEQEIGVPPPQGVTNQAPEIRKYTLQQANYLRKQLVLYCRLTDRSGKLNTVFPIGPMLSFGHPTPQVDRLSNLHVLYQNGPRSFNYTVINPDGEVTLRQTYDMPPRPRLQADEDGNISVAGGRRRVKPDDVPPPPKPPEVKRPTL